MKVDSNESAFFSYCRIRDYRGQVIKYILSVRPLPCLLDLLDIHLTVFHCSFFSIYLPFSIILPSGIWEVDRMKFDLNRFNKYRENNRLEVKEANGGLSGSYGKRTLLLRIHMETELSAVLLREKTDPGQPN